MCPYFRRQKLSESPKFGLMLLEPRVDDDGKTEKTISAVQVLSCVVLDWYNSLMSDFCCNRFRGFDIPSYLQFIPTLDGIIFVL